MAKQRLPVETLKNWTEDDKQNIWELSGQFEGDIILTETERNGVINEKLRWTNREIPYEVDKIFTKEQSDWIKESLNYFAKKTCITARPRTTTDKDYVYITGETSGCWSSVGRQGGRQQLNLQPNTPGTGCLRSATIQHEFLHALGFYHQQSTTNRDDYVTIALENIQSGKEHNFNKYSASVVTDYGVEYDYGSVMHYSAYAFSKNGDKTIIPKKENVEIGQRVEPSKSDILKLGKMYKCA